jgi:mycothiol synthase
MLVGLGHVELTDTTAGPAIELAVHPGHRNRGIGTALLDAALAHCPPPPGPVRLWSHGQDAAAGLLARARGFTTVRQLWQLRRSLVDPLPAVVVPGAVAIRAFDPDRDFDAVLALNAAAFTELPDQGGLTAADLRRRMDQDWFDPDGVLLAVETAGSGTGHVLGFHWTKVHAPHPDPLDPSRELGMLGEVYVVGVHPAARGRGLGRALTLAGLEHLTARGAPTALLYVDGTNTRAIDLYLSLGFSQWDSDTLFRR